MSIKVTVQPRGKDKAVEYHGENVSVEGAVLKIWTEPHEVAAGGLVDLFVGEIIPLDTFSVAKVRRV